MIWRQRIRREKKLKPNKIRTVVVATLLTVLLCAMVAPAAANTRVYAEKVVLVDWFHVGLVYPVSLQANENAYIGGVDQATLDRYAPEHSYVQAWNRQSYGSDKSVLLIPKRYVWHRWSFASEIYLEFLPGQI